MIYMHFDALKVIQEEGRLTAHLAEKKSQILLQENGKHNKRENINPVTFLKIEAHLLQTIPFALTS